jgi:S1-C subfamily serine protease
MQKKLAIDLLGGTVAKAAEAIGVNSQAISQWPDALPPRLADRVIAACVRQGVEIPAAELVLKAA